MLIDLSCRNAYPVWPFLKTNIVGRLLTAKDTGKVQKLISMSLNLPIEHNAYESMSFVHQKNSVYPLLVHIIHRLESVQPLAHGTKDQMNAPPFPVATFVPGSSSGQG